MTQSSPDTSPRIPPLVSLCLPNLNTRPFLEERMETILAQTVKDWELIICDSHSDDGSWEFFQKFKGDPRIRMYQVPREGLYAGWNECLRRATGKFVNVATSDDTARPEFLETLLQPLERRPEVHLSVCDYQKIDELSRPLARKPGLPEQFLGAWAEVPCLRDGRTEFLLHACFGTMWGTMASVVFRRELLARTGMFPQDQMSFGDEEWTLRASLASDVAYTPERLATWRIHGRQATPRVPTRKQKSIICQSLKSVLADPTAGVPEEWKRVPGWDRQILAVRRDDYLRSLGLYRWLAKSDPKQFLSNVMGAVKTEPGWVIHQALNGFSYKEELNPVEAVQNLIKSVGAKWPPQKIRNW
jgi:glycosyltransferase involved in cell wall biosynthesis